MFAAALPPPLSGWSWEREGGWKGIYIKLASIFSPFAARSEERRGGGERGEMGPNFFSISLPLSLERPQNRRLDWRETSSTSEPGVEPFFPL